MRRAGNAKSSPVPLFFPFLPELGTPNRVPTPFSSLFFRIVCVFERAADWHTRRPNRLAGQGSVKVGGEARRVDHAGL